MTAVQSVPWALDFDIDQIRRSPTPTIEIKRQVVDAVAKVEERTHELAATEIAEHARVLAKLQELDGQLASLRAAQAARAAEIDAARAQRGEDLATGANCSTADKTIRNLRDDLDRVSDCISALERRRAPAACEEAVSRWRSLAARREALRTIARDMGDCAAELHTRWDCVVTLRDALLRREDQYGAAVQSAYSSAAAHHPEAS